MRSIARRILNLVSSSPTAPDSCTMASFTTDPAHAEPSLAPDNVSADRSRQQSVEQSASGAGEHDTDDGTGKRKKGTKRRKVNHACLYCRRSHMTCDEGRPCQRWCVCSPHSLLKVSSPARSPRASRTAATSVSNVRLDTSVTTNGELRPRRRPLGALVLRLLRVLL